MRTIRVGSRESRLAVAQTRLVMEAMEAARSDIRTEIVCMKTTGDVILDRTLDKVGGKGLFVRELDAALLEGRVDITVHSLKDVPMETDPRIPLVCFPPREDPRDVLVLPLGRDALDDSLPIGCASPRRALQMERLLPGMEVRPVRGNVITRLSKLDGGEFSALVLAAAGLKRLGLEGRISRYFAPEEMLPAAGQGILAVQGRAGEDLSFLEAVNHAPTAACALAERAFVRALEGGCSSPAAAYAVVEGEELVLTGMDEAGRRDCLCGPVDEPGRLGTALARRMRGGAV